MTITLSKKDIIGGILILVLLFAASLSFVAYRVAAQDGGNAPTASTEENKTTTAQENFDALEQAVTEGNPIPNNIPHGSCRLNLLMMEPTSTTYVAPQDFNNTFLSTSSSSQPFTAMQDINGDNLPDFVYSYQSDNLGTNDTGSGFYGCVYLNNGRTWEKAWECYANTVVSRTTGEVIHRDYRGDCAG